MLNVSTFFRKVYVPYILEGYVSLDAIIDKITSAQLKLSEQILEEEETKLESLIHFCNHDKFLTKGRVYEF